jgi:hypothetical protein
MGELQRFFASFSSKAIPGSLVHLLEEIDDVHVLLHKVLENFLTERGIMQKSYWTQTSLGMTCYIILIQFN